jgi:hypothetical protein
MYFRKQVYQKQGHGDQAACWYPIQEVFIAILQGNEHADIDYEKYE